VCGAYGDTYGTLFSDSGSSDANAGMHRDTGSADTDRLQ
jgi:hypothetical protein